MIQLLLGLYFFRSFWRAAGSRDRSQPAWGLVGLTSFVVPSATLPALVQRFGYYRVENILGDVMAYDPSIIFGVRLGPDLGLLAHLALIVAALLVGAAVATMIRTGLLERAKARCRECGQIVPGHSAWCPDRS